MTAAVYEGLLGFREVAGLRTDDGGRLRSGLLFRSGTPQFLDLATAEALLADTGIRSTIDLRLPHEMATEGRGPLDELGVRQLPRSFAIRGLVSAHSAVAPMNGDDPLLETYLGYLTTNAPATVALLPTLLEADVLPTLVHCTVGKDRTGVAIALLLAAIGIRRADIVADYAAGADDVAAAMDRLRTMPSYAEAVDVYPRAAWQAPPAVMERFLGGVDERHGGVRALLRDAGVTDDTVRRLVDLLITR